MLEALDEEFSGPPRSFSHSTERTESRPGQSSTPSKTPLPSLPMLRDALAVMPEAGPALLVGSGACVAAAVLAAVVHTPPHPDDALMALGE